MSFLYIHGVYHGAWSFAELHPLLQAYSGNQYLIDLRGHHGAQRVQPNDDIGFQDYLQDMTMALDTIPGRKLLLGHSLGGLLSMSVLRRRDVAGAVLLATPLPEIIERKRWALFFQYPLKSVLMVLQRDAAVFYHDRRWVQRYLFGDNMPVSIADAALGKIKSQHEPFRLFDDINTLTIDVSDVQKPVLVITGTEDPTVDEPAAQRLAERFGTASVTLSGAGHDLMLAPEHAKQVAEHVTKWLQSNWV